MLALKDRFSPPQRQTVKWPEAFMGVLPFCAKGVESNHLEHLISDSIFR